MKEKYKILKNHILCNYYIPMYLILPQLKAHLTRKKKGKNRTSLSPLPPLPYPSSPYSLQIVSKYIKVKTCAAQQDCKMDTARKALLNTSVLYNKNNKQTKEAIKAQALEERATRTTCRRRVWSRSPGQY